MSVTQTFPAWPGPHDSQKHFARRTVAIVTAVALSAGVAYGKGGTAKPPTVSAVPLVSILPPAGPTLAVANPAANGFSVTGLIQTVTPGGGACGAPNGTGGGTVTVNGLNILIPSNTIVQYPANTKTWTDAVCGIAPIALDGSGGLPPVLYPGVEVRVDGNIIGGNYIGALVYISQQSANSGSGYISSINYGDGSMLVNSNGGTQVRLLINDPNGRFGRVQSSPDARFSVDDANPTIKAAATGYPMCVPRAAPPAPGGAETDPLCPQMNRPRVPNCRNFVQSGIAAPAGGDLTPAPAPAVFCSAFVMKAVAGMPGTAGFVGVLAGNLRAATEPDPRQQAPFEVGDFISWAGTLVPDPTSPGGFVIWVHTIDANVGIYTQPNTLPSYVAVGEFVIGVDPTTKAAAVVPGVESTPRISLEAGTSDIGSIVDIYLDDKGFALGNAAGPLLATPGAEFFRWVTMESMTGTLTDLAAGKNVYLTTPQPFGGGIATQYVGPQPGRARIRATKVPSINGTAGVCPPTGGSQNCAVTNSPTRYLRVLVRSLCAPAAGFPANTPAGNPGNLDGGAFFSINGGRASLPGAGPGLSGVPASDGTCLQSAQFANGLFTGQYMAPVGEFIFPENTLAGSTIVPNNFNQMGFLVYGEGGNGTTADSQAPQVPRPW